LLRVQRRSEGVDVKNLRPDDRPDRLAWFNPEADTIGNRKFRWAMTGILLIEAMAVAGMAVLVGFTR
jgi:hypothetical protein